MNNFEHADRLEYLSTCYDKFELAREIVALESQVQLERRELEEAKKQLAMMRSA